MIDGAYGEEVAIVDPSDVVSDIKDGKFRQEIAKIRTLYAETLRNTDGDHKEAKRAADPFKRRLPGIMWSGTFSGRGDGNLVGYSGLLCADLDHLDSNTILAARQKAEADPHVFAAFTSPTGTGIKIVFTVGGTAEQHHANFLAVKRHVAEHYGLEVDGACKNPERLCFVSDDPTAFCNHHAIALEPVTEAALERKTPATFAALSVSSPLTRKEIASSILGQIRWASDTDGFCRCPGAHLHSAGDGERDCKVMVDGAPTVSCFHQSCAGIIAGVNHQLRSEVAKAERNNTKVKADKPAPPLPEGLAALVPTYGEPFKRDGGQVSAINQRFWAGVMLAENRILYEPLEQSFYLYEASRGLWQPVTNEQLIERLSSRLFRHRMESGEGSIEQQITHARTRDSVLMMRGMAERRGAFENKPHLIHVANGVLRFDGGTHVFEGFSPDHYSRNQSPIAYIEGADCPRFRAELLESALSHEDIFLLQRHAGMALYGLNLAQRILLLEGTPGGGKSTYVKVLSKLLGVENCYQLRTVCLHGRFETFRYRGKTMLVGADVPGDFLQHRGASVLKSLVGGDLISCEGKSSNGDFHVHGQFNVTITSNSRLMARLEGDAGAWKRRLMIVRYENPPPKKQILDFDQLLIKEEGPGILNWALDGFAAALAEFNETGDFILTRVQQQRTKALLDESDSVAHFLKACVVTGGAGDDITSAELSEAYSAYCADQGWNALPLNVVAMQFDDHMLRMFRTVKSQSIKREGRFARGWRRVKLCTSEGPF
jgi:P4 family phage/plasmid primase-like protien